MTAPPVKSAPQSQSVQTRQHPELVPQPKYKKSGIKRSLFWALSIFAAINVGMAQLSAIEQNKSAKAAGGDFWTNPVLIDLAIKEFNAQQPPAKVVLLGSSLVMFPFWAMDASFEHKISDIAHYHKSAALEAALAKSGLANMPVFSLASAGQMSSDTYLYVNEFLKGDRKPEVLVLGIAPRDFSDNNVKSPTATVSFQQIVGLPNFVAYSKTFMPRFEDKAEFVANHSCFFYGRRWRLQKEVDKGIERLSQTIARLATFGTVKPVAKAPQFSPEQAQLMAAVNHATAGGAVNSNEATALLFAASLEQRWNSSAKEYVGRYKGIADRDMTVQLSCLDKTLKICQERGIKVVIVNMPLTAINQKLMPEGFYNRFSTAVQKTSAKYDKSVTYLDVSHNAAFQDGDYWDTVHMNHKGGAKLLSVIVPAIKDYMIKQ